MTTLAFISRTLPVLAGLGAQLPARAQTLTADWAVACGSQNFQPALAVDTQGNTYIAGVFSGTLTLGATTLTATQTSPGNTGPYDCYVAKLNGQGQYEWAMQFGDGQSGQAVSLAVDNAGHLFLTGGFDSYSLQIGAGGPTLYNSSANGEGFVASLSVQTGQCQWARRFGGTGYDGGYALYLNPGGELYLLGNTGNGAADLGPFSLPAFTAYPYRRQFLAKLSPIGTWLWVQRPAADLYNLQFDGQGSFYAAGSFASPGVTVGNTTLTTNALSGGSPGSDGFIVKYTEGGAVRWARQANPGGTNALNMGTIYDGQGSLYVSGNFSSQTAQLGPFPLANAGPLLPPPNPLPPNYVPNTDRYYDDAFVARLDTAGTWRWATRRGAAGTYDYARAPVLADMGRLAVVYDSGPYAYGSSEAVHLTWVDNATGTWGPQYTLPPRTRLYADQLGRLYVYGTFTGSSLSLGGQTVAGAGGTATTGFVARLGALALAAQPGRGAAGAGLQLWPSPGPGTGVWVQGGAAGQAVEVFDVLGRRVGGGVVPGGGGPLRLGWGGAGLAPGLYLVRCHGLSARWLVEN